MRRLCELVAIAAPALALAFAGPARAEERARARLVYANEAAAPCPDEGAVKRLVGARLGYEAFASDAARTISLRVARRGAGFHGTVDVREADAPTGHRELESSSCDELVSSLAVDIAVAIDPLALVPREPAPPPPPTPAAVAPEREPSPFDDGGATPDRDAARPLPDDGARFRVGIGPILSVGALPTAAAGVVIGAGARWRSFSIGGEGRLDVPLGSSSASGGRISASLLAGSIVPCYHAGIARVCGLVSAGALRGSGKAVAAPLQASVAWAAAGARTGVDVPLGESISVGAHADLYLALSRITLELDGQDAWTSPPVSAAFGVSAQGTF